MNCHELLYCNYYYHWCKGEQVYMKKTVLIVDDSMLAYEEMKTLLTGLDFSVVGHCKSGEDALEANRTLRPDLITLDFIMPGMDGIETCRKLLDETPDVKILLVGSMAYDETEQSSIKAGASGFIYKPVKKKWLVKALVDAFDGLAGVNPDCED